jgi:hypothetical protein
MAVLDRILKSAAKSSPPAPKVANLDMAAKLRNESVSVSPSKSATNNATKNRIGIQKEVDEDSGGGGCDCPDDKDSAGKRCGRRSAFDRSGGKRPTCGGAGKDRVAGLISGSETIESAVGSVVQDAVENVKNGIIGDALEAVSGFVTEPVRKALEAARENEIKAKESGDRNSGFESIKAGIAAAIASDRGVPEITEDSSIDEIIEATEKINELTGFGGRISSETEPEVVHHLIPESKPDPVFDDVAEIPTTGEMTSFGAEGTDWYEETRYELIQRTDGLISDAEIRQRMNGKVEDVFKGL